MDASDFQPLVDWLNAHPDWIFTSIAVVAFIESLALAGVIVPGVLLLFLVAVVAGGGALSLELSLLAGFIGAVLGDGISYLLGRYFKDDLPHKWPFRNYPKMLALGRDYFFQHGGKSVVIGRFVGPLRPVLPLVAGMFGMSPARFFSFNLLSACAWSPVYIVPGYLTGAATQLALPENFYSVIGSFGIIILLVAICFRWLSIQLQVNNNWHDAAESRRVKSPILNRIWTDITQKNSLTGEFPLASLTLAISSLFLFVLLSIISNASSILTPLDTFVSQFMFSATNNSLVAIASAITLLGDRIWLYISFTILVVMFLAKRNYAAALHIVAAGLATDLITHQLKDFFALARPGVVSLAPASYAYPSGHTSGATIFYGLLASFIAQECRPVHRWRIYLGFAVPIILIAISRVVLNVHWLSDILGGLLLGLLICGLTRCVYSRFEQHSIYFMAKKNNLWFLLSWLLCAMLYIAWNLDTTIVRFSPGQ